MNKLSLPKIKDCESFTEFDQISKIYEEILEFMDEIKKVKILNKCFILKNKDRIVSEAFDIIQSLMTFLNILGIDIEKANNRHIQKLKKRKVTIDGNVNILNFQESFIGGS